MEELIKKVAEAFRDYVLQSPELQELVEKIVERKAEDVNTYQIKSLISDALEEVDWDDFINDNLDTSSSAFVSGVKDVVHDMTFRVEVH